MKITLIKDMYTQAPFKLQKRTLRFLPSVICLLFIVILQQNIIAQTLGINTTGALPDSSAMLDIVSPTKGLLIPRVSLASTTDTTTITNPATSLLVYNTNAGMTGGSGLGYYFYNGSMWMNFLSGTDNSLTTPLIIGGSGTTSSLTYKPTTGVGTTGADHIFKVGNNGGTEAMRILNSGILQMANNKYISLPNYTQLDFKNSSGTQGYGQIFVDNATGTYAGANGMAFFLNGASRLAIQSGGNVGIGTTTPLSKLDVVGAAGVASFTGTTRLGVTIEGSTASTNIVGIDFLGDIANVGNNPLGRIGMYRTANGSYLQFGTSNSWAGGITNQALTIDYTGNIGIGTSTPNMALEIDKALPLIRYRRTGAYNWNAGVGNGTTNIPSSYFGIEDVSTLAARLVIAHTTGYVGIGITSPSAKFHVLSTTEQSRFGYDASNYYSTTVGSTGAVTFDAVGAGSAFTFSDAVNLPTASVGVTQTLNDSTTKLATTAFVDRALSGVSGGSGWGLTGTSGTVDGTNFIGTTDNIPFNIKVNNQKAGRIDHLLFNVFWGYQAGTSNTTGYDNIAIGHQALYSNTTGYENTATGFKVLYANTTGFGNTGLGSYSLISNTTGYYNTANGFEALRYNTTGANNTAVGYQALIANTSGQPNQAFGSQSLSANTTGIDNNAFGYNSLKSNTTGPNNAAFGNYSSWKNTSGSNNVALGHTALQENLVGSSNVAVGYQALLYNTASNNTGIGTNALNANTTGTSNTALGYQALKLNTTGVGNTADGYNALYSNTTGSYNTANGISSLNFNTTGDYNTASGWLSLYSNTTGIRNTANGVNALYSNTTGSYNTATGKDVLNGNTVGGENTGSGNYALFSNTTGTKNTAFGYHTGVTNTTGSNNTYLGSETDGSANNLTNSTAVGAYAAVNATNKVRIGDANVTVIEGQVAYTSVSDGRFKKNISESDVKGLSFIMRLRPVVYNIDTRQFEEFLVKNKPDSVKVKHFKNRDFTASTAIRHSGFVAQEVEAAAQATNYDFGGLHKPENADDNYGLAYAEFVVPLVKAMQEQQQQLIAKDAILISLQNQIDQLTILIQQNKTPK